MQRRGSLRASDADREQIVDRLRKAAAEGRLAMHELEQRVGRALRARTYAELDATVSGLPGKRLSEGSGRSLSRRAGRMVADHPALLLIAVPVAMAALATLLAIALLWSAIMLVLFMLGQGRHCRRRWTYSSSRRFGPPYGAHGGPGRWL